MLRRDGILHAEQGADLVEHLGQFLVKGGKEGRVAVLFQRRRQFLQPAGADITAQALQAMQVTAVLRVVEVQAQVGIGLDETGQNPLVQRHVATHQGQSPRLIQVAFAPVGCPGNIGRGAAGRGAGFGPWVMSFIPLVVIYGVHVILLQVIHELIYVKSR